MLYGGRIDPGKGCEELIEYFSSYVQAGGEATLTLMGVKLMSLPEEPFIARAGGLVHRLRQSIAVGFQLLKFSAQILFARRQIRQPAIEGAFDFGRVLARRGYFSLPGVALFLTSPMCALNGGRMDSVVINSTNDTATDDTVVCSAKG